MAFFFAKLMGHSPTKCECPTYFLLFLSLNPCQDVALADLGTLFGLHIDELAAEGCGNGNNLAPFLHQIAEGLALLIGLADERLNTGSTLAVAVELVEDLSG